MTTVKTILRSVVVLSVIAAGACFPFKREKPYPKLPVTAKEGINVLVSNDARCLVSTKQFALAKVGGLQGCNWRIAGVAVATPASAKK